MAVKKYIDSDKDPISFWTNWWDQHDLNDLLGGMKYYDEYPYCLKWLSKHMEILDAGCGLGQYSISLSSLGYNVIGLDFSTNLISRTKKKFGAQNFVAGDTNILPFSDKCFDAILSFGVIEHFEDGPEKALNEFSRTLKDGGILILSVPYCNILRKIRYAFSCLEAINTNRRGREKHKTFHQYLFTKKEIFTFLNENFLIEQCDNAYYQTNLYKVQLFKSIKNSIFQSSTDSVSRFESKTKFWQKSSASLVEKKTSQIKSFLKRYSSRILNMIMPHFVIIICRKK